MKCCLSGKKGKSSGGERELWASAEGEGETRRRKRPTLPLSRGEERGSYAYKRSGGGDSPPPTSIGSSRQVGERFDDFALHTHSNIFLDSLKNKRGSSLCATVVQKSLVRSPLPPSRTDCAQRRGTFSAFGRSFFSLPPPYFPNSFCHSRRVSSSSSLLCPRDITSAGNGSRRRRRRRNKKGGGGGGDKRQTAAIRICLGDSRVGERERSSPLSFFLLSQPCPFSFPEKNFFASSFFSRAHSRCI